MTRNSMWTVSLLAALALPALAHEKGVIAVTPKQVAAGGEVVVRGQQLTKNAALRMQLRGTLETFDLSGVRTDTAGRFDVRFAVPPGVKAGTYTLVVLASDGDVSARTDVVVTAAMPNLVDPMADMEAHTGMAMPPGGMGQHATADMMEVPVDTGAAEWTVIAAFIVLSGTAGLFLLATTRRAVPSRDRSAG